MRHHGVRTIYAVRLMRLVESYAVSGTTHTIRHLVWSNSFES